ncbi:glycine cleavage system protein H, partial [Acinetobacter baumannii]|uniref:glycine cleavage system protein H n=1 Tax=Acinetobacter baumannii TaxID=470 RepID=UPI001AEC9DEF
EEVDGVVTVGLTSVAQDDLGSISFVMFPKVGTVVTQGDSVVELEAEKAVVEYETPVSGTIVEINEAGQKDTKILDKPKAWLFKVKK